MNAVKLRLNRGDAVQVRFATHDGYIWHPAVVLHANEDKIEVEYASGHRRTLPNEPGYFRPVRVAR